MTEPRGAASASRGERLVELAWLFSRLGATAFGGPAAHIAMMDDEIVRRRQWLTRDEFLDLVGATNLIPGPNSTELAIHIGYRRAGWPGLLVAGASFIVPAALVTLALAVAYVRFGKVPAAGGLLYGVKPVIIPVVAQALWKLGRTAVKTPLLAALGVVATALAFLRVDELAILFGAGFVGVVTSKARANDDSSALVLFGGGATASAVGAAAAPSTLAVFFVFAKIGSVLFGSGYVLLAFLRADLVETRHWLTDAQLVDAVAVGQLTPGPVFTTATFVGYLVHGTSGAIVATLGIFLPAFVFVAFSGLLVPKLRASRGAGGFLDGVNVASPGLMAVVTVDLARASFVDLPALAIGLVSAALLFRFKVNATWLVLGGAGAGIVLQALR